MRESKVVVGRLVAVVGPPDQSPRRAAKVGGEPPEWIQIFPDGDYTYDWEGKSETATCDAESRAITIASFAARGNDLVIDYEHQTLDGNQAPAAGWIKELADRGAEGLWARVEWTEKAKEYLRSGEYRYDSPVFTVDSTTRRVVQLHHIALTNWPASHNRTALTEQIAAKARARYDRKTTAREAVMDKGMVRSIICWGRELPPTATNNDVRTYLEQLLANVPANDNLFILDEPVAGATSVAASLGITISDEAVVTTVAAKSVLDELDLPETASLAQVHAAIGDFKAASAAKGELARVTAELKAAKEQVVTLSAKSEEEKLNLLVTKYKAKLPPSKEPWFRALAKRHGLEHAEEVARNLKDELPVDVDAAPAVIEEETITAGAGGHPTGAIRKAKVEKIMTELSLEYEPANEELRRREKLARV